MNPPIPQPNKISKILANLSTLCLIYGNSDQSRLFPFRYYEKQSKRLRESVALLSD